jgi:hypothetical protein
MKPSEFRALEIMLLQAIAELLTEPWSVAAPFREALDRAKQLREDGRL